MNTNGIPVWEKYVLTIEEAAEYFHIGENKIRKLITSNPSANYLLWIGNRTLIKRKKFENFVDEIDSL
ncbi:MAG: helix-turn-helix domain-containing protein [Eubacterium sp.]|nr:helix-turn-helix domain-containing protein [Eubacterium sp.]